MLSTQLPEGASTLIGQGRPNREEGGLMAEQRGQNEQKHVSETITQISDGSFWHIATRNPQCCTQ